ncbi:DUF4007 family protein [Vibrio hangzhouensis]|uniref:DUF4007 family protein n=1 Tax=Vibrio hangzhouensis TaxID=462991 RepID=UPI001FC942FA|nr:DUF4007 family protein [Vibrio hangzhouensis]
MSIESSSLKFSGHQTFPIRYGWIYKIIQEVKDGKSIAGKDEVESQMERMGMGKNMVLSVRHWVRALNLVTCTDKKALTYELTPLAHKLFVGENAYDEYLDKIGTTWLLHWLLQSIPTEKAELNASRFFFNYFNGIKVSKDRLTIDIHDSLAHHDKPLTDATLGKDIDCLLQMYAQKTLQPGKINEDSFASPFTELGLLKHEEGKNYLAELSKRSSLPIETFAYAVIDFMQNKLKDSNVNTLSFDALLNDIGSPGKVFRLSSNGLSEKLDELELLSEGRIAWTDTQGLRQLQHSFENLATVEPSLYLEQYYLTNKNKEQ